MSQLVFGKYEILRRIAVGGMGEIFLARQSDTLIDRYVILKSMLPDLAEDETWVEQFLGNGSYGGNCSFSLLRRLNS